MGRLRGKGCAVSIWGNWPDVGYEIDTRLSKDEHGEPILVAVGHEGPERGEVRSYATGFSNHYPTTDGEYEQPANVGISGMPAWCVPGHSDEYTDDLGPWVRLDVQTCEHDFAAGGTPTGRYDVASVVMDEAAARALAADLIAWADRPKVQPGLTPTST
jgi:hypothetical protein